MGITDPTPDDLRGLAAQLAAARATLLEALVTSARKAFGRPDADAPSLLAGLDRTLDEIVATLGAAPFVPGPAAREHGAERAAAGWPVASVVRGFALLRLATHAASEPANPARGALDLALDASCEAAVTAHAHAERARTARALRSRLGTVAHDLRGPLSSARYAAELIREMLPRVDEQALGVLGRGLDRLQNALDTVVVDGRLAHLAAEPTPIAAPVPATAAALVEQALVAVRAAAAQRGVHLRVGDVTEAEVAGDAEPIREALRHVLANAVAATPPGGEVRVRARTAGLADDQVTFEVEDDGADLSRETLEAMRLPFTQPRAGLATSGAGLGAVLAAVGPAGGTLQLEAGAAGGCRVRLELPRAVTRSPAGRT